MIKIEDRPVGFDPVKTEIREAVGKLKVGQSFLIPRIYREVARTAAQKLSGKFATAKEGDQTRIGRVA